MAQTHSFDRAPAFERDNARPAGILAAIASALALFGAARRTAAAIDLHRRPDAEDLARLGVTPETFDYLKGR